MHLNLFNNSDDQLNVYVLLVYWSQTKLTMGIYILYNATIPMYRRNTPALYSEVILTRKTSCSTSGVLYGSTEFVKLE